MRLGLLTIVITISIINLLNGQEPFNKLYHLDHHQLIGYKIIEVDSDFIIFGDGLRKGLDRREDESFALRVNAKGDVQWGGFYQEDNTYFSFTNLSPSLAHIDGSVYGLVSEQSGQPDWMERNFAFILRYDIATDSLYNYHIIDDTASDFNSPAATGIIQTPSNTLLTCFTQFIGSEIKHEEMLVQEIDPGEDAMLLKEFRFGDPEYRFFAYGLVNISGGYLLFGLSKHIDDNTRSNFILISLDYELELQEYRMYDNLNYNASRLQMIKDTDDNYVGFFNESSFDPTAPSFSQFSSRPIVTKFSPDLEILWQKPATHNDFRRKPDFQGGIVASHDGDSYFLLGETQGDELDNGFITKYSKEGDSLWYRVIEPIERQAEIDFTVAIQTSDGYYMALGSARPVPSEEERFHQTFLYKFDEEGHVVNVDRTSVIEEDLLPEIRIFPNPTTEILYIEHDEARDITYRLYDNQGKQLMHKTDTQAYHTYILDVSSYSPGTYWLEILDADGSRRVKAVQVY